MADSIPAGDETVVATTTDVPSPLAVSQRLRGRTNHFQRNTQPPAALKPRSETPNVKGSE